MGADMPRAIQWLLAVMFPLGFGPLVLLVLPDTPLARWVGDVVWALLLQPAVRLWGITEAQYWKMFAAVAIVTASFIPLPRTRFDQWIVLGILALPFAVGCFRLIQWIRRNPRRV